MSVGPTGGSSNDNGAAAKRRALEEERQRGLSNVEERYTTERSDLEAARADQLRRVRSNQVDEIRRAQSDADYKISGANQQADAQLRKFQSDTAQVTSEAARQYRNKAGELVKTQKELEHQERTLTQRHMDAMRTIGSDQANSQAVTRARAQGEMEELTTEYDRRIRELETKGRQDEINTTQTYRAEVEKARNAGEMELSGLKSNQQRMKEQLREQETGIQAEEHKRLENLRHDNEFRYQDEETRGTKAITEVQTKSQKAIRDTAAHGERDILSTREHYALETRDIQKAAETKLADTKAFEERGLYQIQKTYGDDKRRAEATHFQQINLLRERSDALLAGAGAQNEATRKKIDADYIKTSQTLRANRDFTLTQVNEQTKQALAGVAARSDAQLEKAKADSAVAIESHGAKASDPFYRPHSLNTRLTESEAGFLVEVAIPEHEKDSVRVVKNKSSITVSGNRRYEGKARLEPGHDISTNSYQAYSESFAIVGPVNMSGMSRTYADGKVKVFIPKV